MVNIFIGCSNLFIYFLNNNYVFILLLPVYRKEEVINDPEVKQLVAEQSKEWTEMIGRHYKEEWTLLKEQLEAQKEILKVTMVAAQAAQIKLLDARLEKYFKNKLSFDFMINKYVIINRENKDLKTKQAKMAVETAKEVANDKTLRNKADKERRLREKNQNNTKKFIEERKITAMKQGREKEKLLAVHAKQLEELNRDIQLVNSIQITFCFCFLL